jgi:hypothetical protein
MAAASRYLSDLGKASLDSTELAHFIALMSEARGKDERQAAIDHLLRIVDLTADQVATLAVSEPVVNAAGLQLSVRRYARPGSMRRRDRRQRKSLHGVMHSCFLRRPLDAGPWRQTSRRGGSGVNIVDTHHCHVSIGFSDHAPNDRSLPDKPGR